MKWQKCGEKEFTGNPPCPRSGHTSSLVNESRLVIFGGIVDKELLTDLTVLETDTRFWFSPEVSGTSSSENMVGPTPRAFHCASSIGSNLFIFGGRGSGNKILNDFWMLDTDTWLWAELSSFGDLPPRREFATMVTLSSSRLLIYGGWDGSKWLSDVHILDTMSLEWRQLPVPGISPPPRCSHAAILVEKRLLVFGGRGYAGSVNGELWALKGIFDDEPAPGWTQLKLPGTPPFARCGHTCVSFGPQVLIFGGHGYSGWIQRNPIYLNDLVSLDRVSVQWKVLGSSPVSPSPRAYHSLTPVPGGRFLLIGGLGAGQSQQGTTQGDLWWLLRDDDPLLTEVKDSLLENPIPAPPANESMPQTPKELAGVVSLSLESLRERMGLGPLWANGTATAVKLQFDGLDDPELIHFGLKKSGKVSRAEDAVVAARRFLASVEPDSIALRDLSVVLREYKRMVAYCDGLSQRSDKERKAHHKFFHVERVDEIHVCDVPLLLEEYQSLLKLFLVDL